MMVLAASIINILAAIIKLCCHLHINLLTELSIIHTVNSGNHTTVTNCASYFYLI